MTSLSVVSIISQWPIWIVFHLLRWNILSKQKEEKPLISLYASATQRPRTSLEALLQSWNLNHLSWNEKALGGRSFKLYELKFIEYLEKKWKIACEQHEFHWRSLIVAHMLSFIFSLNAWRLSIIKLRKFKLVDVCWTLLVFRLCCSRQEIIINTHTWPTLLTDHNLKFSRSVSIQLII